MVEIVLPLFIGMALGFLAGLGAGGGSLLLLWLTQAAGMEQPQARILNLLFYLPSALVSTLFRMKRGSIDQKIVLPGLICGCISAAILSFASRQMDVELAKKLLGGLLIAVGIREIFYRPRKAR